LDHDYVPFREEVTGEGQGLGPWTGNLEGQKEKNSDFGIKKLFPGYNGTERCDKDPPCKKAGREKEASRNKGSRESEEGVG